MTLNDSLDFLVRSRLELGDKGIDVSCWSYDPDSDEYIVSYEDVTIRVSGYSVRLVMDNS